MDPEMNEIEILGSILEAETGEDEESEATEAGLKPKTRTEIESIVQAAIGAAVDFVESEISQNRIKAQRYYDGKVDIGHESHAKIIAVATLENLAMKVANPALAEMYARQKAKLYMAMEQAFLERVPRRIVKGDPIAGSRFAINPYGSLKLVP
jgi:hypothetical protein